MERQEKDISMYCEIESSYILLIYARQLDLFDGDIINDIIELEALKLFIIFF